jgi:hypothetical protein
MTFEPSIARLIDELKVSPNYRAILWAGGYAVSTRHAHSDVDLYGISTRTLPQHWMMERIDGRRVEVTAYPLDRWTDLLAKPYSHPKHHFTFAHGTPLHDPESLLPALRETAARVLARWPAAPSADLAEMRNGVAIQRDKIEGFREKGMPLHLRMYAEGFALLACGLLATARYGRSVDAGKNLSRLLADAELDQDLKDMFTTLLASTDNHAMADAALALADRCLALTGGPVDSHNGGIVR